MLEQGLYITVELPAGRDHLRGEEGGGVRSGPGEARTILLFHTISARPPKQPRMVRTFLKVHTQQ